jgi:hypothetical protein
VGLVAGATVTLALPALAIEHGDGLASDFITDGAACAAAGIGFLQFMNPPGSIQHQCLSGTAKLG